MGVMAAGGVVSGVNPLCTAAEVAGQLADADARFLVTVPPFLRIAQGAAAGRDTEIVLIGPPTADTTSFAQLLRHTGEPPDVRRLGTPVVPGAAGVLMPGTDARVVDLADGRDLPPGEAGELLIRTPSVMTGYRGAPGATAATVDADGWLHTGDVATVSAEGVVHVVDRVKELIKVRGYQVAPAELEALLRAHPGVAEAAVVPMDDERSGEVPKAFVVRAAGSTVTAEEIVDHVAGRVAGYKRLGAVEFIEAVPTSPAGKTLRRLLKTG